MEWIESRLYLAGLDIIIGQEKGIDIQWYSKGDNQSADYESAVWVPVKRENI